MSSLSRVFFILVLLLSAQAQAGLDLQNQTEIYIPDLDLDGDGRIYRKELAEYMLYYFDRDGNEVLTKGEYHNEREIAIVEYDPNAIDFIDLDNDGKNDATTYDTASFLNTVMVDKEAAAEAEGIIKALRFMDEWFKRLDINKSRAIEMNEWQDEYALHGVNKPRKRPKAANNNRYN